MKGLCKKGDACPMTHTGENGKKAMQKAMENAGKELAAKRQADKAAAQ